MVRRSLLMRALMAVGVPAVTSPAAAAPDPNSVYVGSIVVRADQVASEIERIHSESPQRAVAVRGDRKVAYGEVVKVLDACRTAGYTDVRLISQQRDFPAVRPRT